MTGPARIEFGGRVALVTGAGSGLGRAYALDLAARGARVVVNNRVRGVDKAASVASEIRDAGGQAVVHTGDVATPEGASSAVAAALETWGRLDALVANAGGIRDRSFARMSDDELDAVLRAHLYGAFWTCQPAFRAMKEQGYGRLVLVTSSAALFGNFGQANYAAAKMGVVGLSRAIAVEGERCGVRANAVAPLARTGPAAETLGALGERLDPELVAPLVAYLASESCAVSGEVFSAGGGHFARVFVGLARGWTAPAGEPVRPEAIAAHLDAIRDPAGAHLPGSLAEELALLAAALGQPTPEGGA